MASNSLIKNSSEPCDASIWYCITSLVFKLQCCSGAFPPVSRHERLPLAKAERIEEGPWTPRTSSAICRNLTASVTTTSELCFSPNSTWRRMFPHVLNEGLLTQSLQKLDFVLGWSQAWGARPTCGWGSRVQLRRSRSRRKQSRFRGLGCGFGAWWSPFWERPDQQQLVLPSSGFEKPRTCSPGSNCSNIRSIRYNMFSVWGRV